MAWVKIDDRMPQNAKLMGLSDRAKWVYVASMCYAAAGETDGAIPTGVVKEMGWNRARAELVEADLWHEQPCGKGACQSTARQSEKLTKGGYVVHDFLEYNPSRELREDWREQARERMADVRANKTRTSLEVQPKFAKSSHYPLPLPLPHVLSEHPDPDRAHARGEGEADSEDEPPPIDWDAIDAYAREQGSVEKGMFRRFKD